MPAHNAQEQGVMDILNIKYHTCHSFSIRSIGTNITYGSRFMQNYKLLLKQKKKKKKSDIFIIFPSQILNSIIVLLLILIRIHH